MEEDLGFLSSAVSCNGSFFFLAELGMCHRTNSTFIFGGCLALWMEVSSLLLASFFFQGQVERDLSPLDDLPVN